MIYENTKDYTIEEGCPWYKMQQDFGPPNVNWCEPTRCELINEPATAWSNFGMILPGIILYYLFNKKTQSAMMKLFGLSIIIMGLFSFIYHATNNYATQYLDFIGMYFYTGTIITINFQRLKSFIIKKPWPIFFLVMLINNLLFLIFTKTNGSIQFIIVINLIVVLYQEFILFRQFKGLTQYKNFVLSMIFIAIAQAFSLLDHTRIWCNPENVALHGHAIWHVLAGVSAVFAFLYYKQFDKLLTLKN